MNSLQIQDGFEPYYSGRDPWQKNKVLEKRSEDLKKKADKEALAKPESQIRN